MIEIKNVSFSYSGSLHESKLLFDNLSLTFHKGEHVTIGGANGSGKTTLAALIKGMIQPLSGEIYYQGKKVTGSGINSEIGYIFSNAENQIVSPVVEDDVAFGMENLGFPCSQIECAVLHSLSKVNALELQSKLTHLLSGGEQQKINIAGILAMECKCIIFDEASSMLDPMSRRILMEILKELNRKYGITTIQITHNLYELFNSERVVYFNKGRIVFDGSPDKLVESSDITEYFTEKQSSLVDFFKGMKKISAGASSSRFNMSDLAGVIIKELESKRLH